MCVVAVAMAMAPWITVSELRRDPDCGVDGASSRESRLPPAAEVATAAVGPCEKASIYCNVRNFVARDDVAPMCMPNLHVRVSYRPLDRTGADQNLMKYLDECIRGISPLTFECLCIFRLAADMMPDMMSLAVISRPGLT